MRGTGIATYHFLNIFRCTPATLRCVAMSAIDLEFRNLVRSSIATIAIVALVWRAVALKYSPETVFEGEDKSANCVDEIWACA